MRDLIRRSTIEDVLPEKWVDIVSQILRRTKVKNLFNNFCLMYRRQETHKRYNGVDK